MNLTYIVFGIIFMVSGFVFAAGKWHVHTSAWKNMTEDEKRKVNATALCRNVGTVIMLGGMIFLLKAFIVTFSDKLFVITMIFWLVFSGCDLAYISKSKRYQNDK